MLDLHQHHEKYNYKVYPKYTADIGTGMTTPNLTHSHMNKGFNMLDLHPK